MQRVVTIANPLGAGAFQVVLDEEVFSIKQLKDAIAMQEGIPSCFQSLIGVDSIAAPQDLITHDNYQLVINCCALNEIFQGNHVEAQLDAIQDLETFGTRAGEAGIDQLLHLLEHEQHPIRMGAVRALSHIADKGHDRVKAAVITCLEHELAHVRQTALIGFQALLQPEDYNLANDKLAACILDHHPVVRRTAVEVLSQLGHASTTFWVEMALNTWHGEAVASGHTVKYEGIDDDVCNPFTAIMRIVLQNVQEEEHYSVAKSSLKTFIQDSDPHTRLPAAHILYHLATSRKDQDVKHAALQDIQDAQREVEWEDENGDEWEEALEVD